ncbi:sugar (and other) transporter family protein [Pseudarthrobacter siccitolerans]|uniref:Putative proline/betaine transporter n=1 Tax=Pseudarthrobacter siccitolerans TaxID=861266 RepID=A0A024H338_9MICC|nr:MFS transporter [Pseudarthrobacter siccitolerans]CCQ46141.1 sugar (and other) transporter family protein [Pseudarthrobacter siccitolerans]
MNAETTPHTEVPPEPQSTSIIADGSLAPQVSKRVAVAAGIGHFLEWFDFAVYGFLAVTIGQLFFPSENPTVSLLSSLSVFGVAFLFRPMGGLIIGALGDRLGRRAALSLAIVLMGVCTLAIGLLPTYETIGIAAPILLVVFRCAQGFSAGGEYAGAATFLIEYAPHGRRGLWSSVVSAGAAIGVMGGGVVTLLLASSISSEEMSAWGWRVPFIVAGPLAVLGLYLRLRLEDTPVFRELQRTHEVEHAPLRSASKKSRSGILLVFTCTAVTGLGFYYLATFVITFLTVKVNMPRTAALELSILGLLIYSIMCPIAGMIGDRIGRRKTMLIGTIGIAVVTIPCFMLLGTGNWFLGLAGLVIFAAFEALVNVMLGVLMVELFPARLRVSGSSIGFNVAQALIGGPGPFIATAIASAFALLVAPAFYLAAVALICFFVLLRYLPETRGVSLSSNEAVKTHS